MENKEYQVVTSPSAARHLIQRGMRVVDIKPSKFDAKQTVFVFDNTAEFQEMYHTELEKVKAAKEII
ncbi:MAG: DUF5659 domain-containing protein [Candidatus Gastranaerophilales bacterium]|nr:DUF5659 domain-containing protein [Candidatus Gastranaerophilales bacterium]